MLLSIEDSLRVAYAISIDARRVILEMLLSNLLDGVVLEMLFIELFVLDYRKGIILLFFILFEDYLSAS